MVSSKLRYTSFSHHVLIYAKELGTGGEVKAEEELILACMMAFDVI